MLREVAYFPWVGSHSTSHQLVHAMHHMFEWMANDPSSRTALEHDDINRQRFVHESMRLHPASPVARRIAVDDVTLKSGRVVPGMWVALPRVQFIFILGCEVLSFDNSVFVLFVIVDLLP